MINLLEYSWAEENVDLLIGMLISLGVYTVYCIMHEAFLSLNQNPKRYALVLVFVGLANGISAIRQLRAGEAIIQNGRITSSSLNLLCAVFMFVILAAMLLKHFMSKREVD